jgi:hypothetical protein
MIYVIRAGNSMMVKIGFTKHQSGLENRLLQLKCSCPYPLRVEATMVGSKLKESYLHSICLPRHESGEWFRLSIDEVKRMATKYKNWTPAQEGIRKMKKLHHQVNKPYFK